MAQLSPSLFDIFLKNMLHLYLFTNCTKLSLTCFYCDTAQSLLVMFCEVAKLITCRCCQNPNLNTTQPNYNLVGFDMIITLHPQPTTHHRNSNSTRNGPRGLKFGMQPLPAILTTTQHNFNPTIFYRGEGHISSGLV